MFIFQRLFKKEDINIMADDLLKEIFINIFSNSLKYNNQQKYMYQYILLFLNIIFTDENIG